MAFDTLYRTLQPGLLRYLRALIGADAEDVASETWLQIVRDLETFRGTGSGFRAWMVTIARHRALDLVRHRQRRPHTLVPVESLAEMPSDMDTAGIASDEISTAAAIAMVASLPPDQAEAVLLRVVVGLDAITTAEILGKRPGAVRSSAHRGLHRLADMLAARPATRDRPGTGPA
jgi:RNA polymerase sigma-70 factor (ECF subfamily)